MGDKKNNTGFIKVTDESVTSGATVGYHTVGADWIPFNKPGGPQMNGDDQDWEFVDEAEVREKAPQVLSHEGSDEPKAVAKKAPIKKAPVKKAPETVAPEVVEAPAAAE